MTAHQLMLGSVTDRSQERTIQVYFQDRAPYFFQVFSSSISFATPSKPQKFSIDHHHCLSLPLNLMIVNFKAKVSQFFPHHFFMGQKIICLVSTIGCFAVSQAWLDRTFVSVKISFTKSSTLMVNWFYGVNFKSFPKALQVPGAYTVTTLLC